MKINMIQYCVFFGVPSGTLPETAIHWLGKRIRNATIYKATGVWQEQLESSVVLEALLPTVSHDWDRAIIKDLANNYCEYFSQSSYLFTESAVNGELIEVKRDLVENAKGCA